MERSRSGCTPGWPSDGITGEVADELFMKMKAFANYGFPESHSVSFAYLVYASSWIKYHEPAAFCAALLNAQPMGFWSPHTLVQDARRHGVSVQTPDLNASGAGATLEPCAGSLGSTARPVSHGFATEPSVEQSLGEGLAVRLGLGSVRSIGSDLADEIEAERKRGVPYSDTEDLVRRVPSLTLAQPRGDGDSRGVRASASGWIVVSRCGPSERPLSRGRVVWRASSPEPTPRACRA